MKGDLQATNKPALPAYGRKRSKIYFLLSILVCAAILFWLFRSISMREVVDLIRKADRRAVGIFILFSLGTSFVRMWRYRLLLSLSGHAPGALPLFLVVLVRNLFSDLLPARIGSLIYIYVLNTRLGVPLSSASSSFALAFVFDMLALAPIIMLAALTAGRTDLLSPAGLLGGALLLGLISLAIMRLLPWILRHAPALAARIFGTRDKIRQKTVQLLQAVEEDVLRAQAAGIFTRVFLLSILIRLGKYAALYAFLAALLLPRGFLLAQLQVPRVFLGLCASELAASLPISGIAGFGVYQGAWTLTFTLLGFPIEIAKLTSLSHHLFTQLYGYSLGLLALLLLLLPVFKQVRARS